MLLIACCRKISCISSKREDTYSDLELLLRWQNRLSVRREEANVSWEFWHRFSQALNSEV